MTFHEVFSELCASKRVSLSAAAVDAGLSKAIVSKWKNAPDSIPNGDTLTKVANYFGISVAELLSMVNGCTVPMASDTVEEAKRIAMTLNQDDLFELQKTVMNRIMELAQKN